MIRPDNNPYSNQHAVDTSSTQKTNTLSPLIEEIRMLSSQQISQFISQLFDSCDDLFYDLSNNANSNQEQTLYFSSMREVRIKRQVLQQNYVARFDESFQNIASSENINIGTTAVNNLAIVENDQIEVDVALTNMSTRANNVCYEEIYPLLIRFDSLFKGRNVDKEHNPLLPEVVCGLFADVCKAHLTISIKPLIILLKQFERFVLERMVQVYVKANQRLIEAGICPEIPRQVRKDSNIGKSDSERKEPASAVDKRATSRNRYNIPLSENSDLNFSLQAFKQLFANARSGNATLDGFRSYSNHSGPFISLSELTNLLNQAQMLVEQNSPYDVDQPHIHAVASKLLGTQSSAASGAVGESEDDTINLVAMFFEFILDDNSIALKLRNQISRLQIPILKLALQDNTFFSNQSHPARNLINIIAAVGVVYNDERELSKDKTYQKIVDVVKTICHQYGFDQQIFAELFPQLEEVVEKEQRRTTVVEKHTAQVETGKSKVKAANKTARAILIKKMHGAKLLSNARDFLIDCWLDVMVMALLKFSENSEEWSTVTRTVDDFIWCCQSDKDAEALARLQKLQPDLLERIGAGLDLLNNNVSKEQELAKIEQLIKANIASPEKTVWQGDIEINKSDDTVTGLGAVNSQPKTAIEMQQEQCTNVGHKILQQANELKLGDWVEYKDTTTAKIIKCKLSAKIESTDSFLFVNRFGLKVLEKSRHAVAYDMQEGRISIIDNTPLVERTLTKIFKKLRKQHRQHTNTLDS